MLFRGRRRGGKVPRYEVCAGRGVEEGMSGVVTPLKRGRERGSGGGEKMKKKKNKTSQWRREMSYLPNCTDGARIRKLRTLSDSLGTLN